MAQHTFHKQGDANRQAIVESMMSALGLTEAEAQDRYDNGNWEGFNSTEAARQFEDEQAALGGPPHRTALSVPYHKEEDGDVKKGLDTVSQPDVPPGVTPPQILVDQKTKKDAEQGKLSKNPASRNAGRDEADKDAEAQRRSAERRNDTSRSDKNKK